MLTKQEADNLMKIKGEARGVNIKIDLDYVLEKKGEPGLREVEKRIAQLGYSLKKKDIRIMDFYPVGIEAIFLLIVKDVLNLNKAGVEEMGRAVVKFSIFMKILMKYFGSMKLVAKEIPGSWREHYTIGSLEMPEFGDNYAILIQKGFKVHPVYSTIHKGYFKKVAQMVVRSEVSCSQRKDIFGGDKYNEFLLTWT